MLIALAHEQTRFKHLFPRHAVNSCGATPLRFAVPAALAYWPQAFRRLGVREYERPADTRLIPAHPPWQISGSPVASPIGRENYHGHFSFPGLTPAGLASAFLPAPVSETNARIVSAHEALKAAKIERA